MAWLAHGSDMGGSLRNPASFCGVVGMRPSIGRVAHTPLAEIDRNLGVQGPMARNVEDLALLLDAMSGEYPADPLSLPALPTSFLSAARVGQASRSASPIRPISASRRSIPRSRRSRGKAAERFAEAGAIVEEAHPDLREAHECFHVLRAFDFAISKAELLRTKRDLLKPEVIWNIEEGLKLTVEQLERARSPARRDDRAHARILQDLRSAAGPATIVAPFPVENRYVAECAGKKFDNYVEWLGIVYAITLVCCPALSLPCGFTASGLPVGLQMVAPPRGEAQLLAGAKLLEDILGLRGTTPIDPRAADTSSSGLEPGPSPQLVVGKPSNAIAKLRRRGVMGPGVRRRQRASRANSPAAPRAAAGGTSPAQDDRPFQVRRARPASACANRVEQRAEHHLKRKADAPRLRRGPAAPHPRQQ